MRFSLSSIENISVVCVFGSSNPLQLPIEKRVIYFHPGEGLSAGNVVYFDGITCDYHAFAMLCKEEVFEQFGYFIHPDKEDSYEEVVAPYIEKCQQIEWQTQLFAGEQKDFGVGAFTNIWNNRESSFYRFEDLKNQCKGIPAVICGAGPSLEQEIDELKKVGNKGIVFAGGAALGILTRKNISVHIGGGVDPYPVFETTAMEGSFEAPFFYPIRFSSSVLEQIQGKSIAVPSNPAYPLDSWLQEGKHFDGGWTVSTFLAALAVYLGCDPVVFLGVDLSYEIDKYAFNFGKGVVASEVRWGEDRTKKDWILAARFLEGLIASEPRSSFYNCSKGLSIEGSIEASFSSLLQEKLLKSHDILGIVHSTCFSMANEERGSRYAALEKSISLSLIWVEKLLALFEKHYPSNPEEKGEFILHQLDLEEEVAYRVILQPAWEIWQHPLRKKTASSYALLLNQLLLFKKILLKYTEVLCKKNGT